MRKFERISCRERAISIDVSTQIYRFVYDRIRRGHNPFNQLVDPWVSQQLQTYLGRQLDKSKMAQGLPADAMFYHKTGWYSYWTHDVGIVDDGHVRYVVACFLPLKAEQALPLHKELARRIFELMASPR